jgi:hypothetical protein
MEIKTHWRKNDSRITSLHLTIESLENSIRELESKIKDVHWYDGDWFMEESEPIAGLSFVAFQNYINSSIYDRYDELSKQYVKYKLGKTIENSNRTQIELIITIANYFKHRDYPKELFVETKNTLKDLNLNCNKDAHIDHSPIFQALNMLTEKGGLNEIKTIVINWRKALWE